MSREGAILDPSEPARKRNNLLHLPAVDFTTGFQNIFIPIKSLSYYDNSLSYYDNGLTRCTPELC
jgi:hypothetical protein